jgi:hypothetical protein
MNVKPGYLIIVLILYCLIGTFGWIISARNTRAQCQAEAVKAGHAQFVVVDEYGRTKFEWLPTHASEKPAPTLEKK